MANRWKGNLVANAATSSGTNYTGRADGSWGLNSQLQQKQGSLWAGGIQAPTPPINVSATAANAQATISFTPQATGGGTVTYTVTSTPGSITATGSTSPITVTGLTNGTSYTFTVRGTNTLGYVGNESSVSNAVIPVASLVIASTASAPYISLHNFTKAGGFGTKISVTTTLTAAANKIYSNNAGNYLATTSDVNYCIYPYGATGLGTRVTGVAAVGTPSSAIFAPNNSSFVYTTNSSPYIVAFPFSSGSLGTKYADPTTLPAGACRGIAFNSLGNTVIASTDTTPYVSAYTWNNGLGTKYAAPTTLPTGLTTAVAFRNTNVVLGLNAGTELQAYSWSNGFGSKFTSPTSRGSNIGDVIFNTAGDLLVAAYPNLASTLSVFPFSAGGFGTRYTDPTSTSSYAPQVTFNGAEDIIFVPDYSGGAKILAGYVWNNGFGTRYANPATAPGGTVTGIAATPY
jgi:hypothetical protein